MNLTNANEPIYKMMDFLGGYHINNYMVRPYDEGQLYTVAEVEAYLAAHPEALVPEPVPPPPTPAQLAAQRRQAILAEIVALDAKTIRPLRAGELNRVAEIEAQVIALRAELAAL